MFKYVIKIGKSIKVKIVESTVQYRGIDRHKSSSL